MTEPSFKTPASAYELPLEPDRPAVKKNALEMVIRTEPIEAEAEHLLGGFGQVSDLIEESGAHRSSSSRPCN
jgi:hypothetical protein